MNCLSPLQREKFIDQYVQAVDEGNLEDIGIILEAASQDAELNRKIREINEIFFEEEFGTESAE